MNIMIKFSDILKNSIRITTTLGNKIALEQQLELQLKKEKNDVLTRLHS